MSLLTENVFQLNERYCASTNSDANESDNTFFERFDVMEMLLINKFIVAFIYIQILYGKILFLHLPSHAEFLN